MKKKMTLVLSIICIICSCIACIQISGVEQKTEIKNLAYDFKKSADHMVYIKENGKRKKNTKTKECFLVVGWANIGTMTLRIR